EWERARDLVQRDRGRLRREPSEIVEEAVGDRDADALRDHLGAQAFERARPLDRRIDAERRDALPKQASPDLAISMRMELEQPLEEVGARAHQLFLPTRIDEWRAPFPASIGLARRDRGPCATKRSLVQGSQACFAGALLGWRRRARGGKGPAMRFGSICAAHL